MTAATALAWAVIGLVVALLIVWGCCSLISGK